jgi:hypothetical protein
VKDRYVICGAKLKDFAGAAAQRIGVSSESMEGAVRLGLASMLFDDAPAPLATDDTRFLSHTAKWLVWPSSSAERNICTISIRLAQLEARSVFGAYIHFRRHENPRCAASGRVTRTEACGRPALA